MTINLKAYFDAAQAANEDVLKIADEIDGKFSEGTAEAVESAMSRRGELEAAQAKAGEAVKLYEAMKAAAQTGEASAAAKFVPVDESAKVQDEKKTVTRAEYEAMAYDERHAFFKAGGQIVE